MKARAGLPQNQAKAQNDQNVPPTKKVVKRKADSPARQDVKTKMTRFALGNLTNAVTNVGKEPLKAIGNTMVKRDTMGPPPLKKPATTTSNALTTRQSLMPIAKKENKGFQPPQVLHTNPKIVTDLVSNIKLEQAPRPTKVITRAAARAVQSKPAHTNETVIKKEKELQLPTVGNRPTRRISNEFEKSKTDDDTLYMSALESW